MEEPKVEVSKEEVKESKERYETTDIVTETAPAVKDSKTEKIFVGQDLLLEILNKVDKIERAVA